MQQLVSIYLFTVPVLLGILMLWQHSRGTVPLLSLRNFSLVGLIVFQYFSGGLHLATDDYVGFPVANPAETGLVYAGILTAFTILFLIMYQVGWPGKQLAKPIPINRSVPHDAVLLVLAFVLLAIGTGLRYVPIPYIGIISSFFGFGLIAVASGLAGWTLVRHYLNPIYIILCSSIFAAASIVSILGVFGRRGLVAAAAGFIWGAFYGKLRHIDTRWLVVAVLILSIPGVYLTAAFTAKRSVADRRSTVMTLFGGLANPRFEETIPALLSGQSCGPVSFFVIENYPSVHQANFLGSITYFFLVPVPRSIWPEKPTPLSTEIASNSLKTGVNRSGITLPPGLVGYVAAEGGIIALLVYAWFFGVSLRFFDQLIARAPWNPLIIMPVGSALGQILGLFRGEMGIFLFAHTMSFIGTYVACVLIGKVVDRMVGKSLPVEQLSESGAASTVEYDDEFGGEWAGAHDHQGQYGEY